MKGTELIVYDSDKNESECGQCPGGSVTAVEIRLDNVTIRRYERCDRCGHRFGFRTVTLVPEHENAT